MKDSEQISSFFCVNWKIFHIFAAVIHYKLQHIMDLAISNSIYTKAQTCARQQGMNLNDIVESFLVRFISQNQATEEFQAPDVVLSLLGAGERVGDDDLNAREAYAQYLEKKYQ